jgi:general transcription factor IIIA
VERVYLCGHEDCEASFSKWSLLQSHIKETHRYHCDICGREFKQIQYLNAHKVVHTKEKRSFPCPFEGCAKCYVKVVFITFYIYGFFYLYLYLGR